MTGYMNSANDRDYFVLDAVPGSIYDIQLSGVKGINCSIVIWKGYDEPKLVKWIDDNRKSSPERFANLSATGGTYYIEILESDRDPKKENRETPYELRVKAREAISEETEPNDSKEEAVPLTPDREVTGFFSPAYNRGNENKDNLHREEDWYMFEANLASDSPALADATLSGVYGVNSVLSLYDDDGDEIEVSDNGGVGEPESISGAGIQKPGRYYLFVASKGYASNNDEPYTLKVSLREHDPGTEMEKNDDFDSANTIVNNVITGAINSRDDQDVYLYQVSGSTLYRIELRPSETMDAMLAIYRGDKEKIIDINNGGRGKKEAYPNFFTDANFNIVVASKSSAGTPGEEYVLSVTPFMNTDNQESEPNNELSQSNRIPGTVMKGFTSYKGDKDFFLLSYKSRVKEKFEIKGVKGGQIRVSITDPLGYITKSVDVRGERTVTFSEMIDKKGYCIVESVAENYDNPYTIILGGGP
ncbi:MAG: hypothetical protein A2176_15475 [Spirochaetes bacterium RBG_13_51_14]|nr:MAG: hypothetical protein A2176_15475 [Spirochaetes bacterium RBG_13_51_14]